MSVDPVAIYAAVVSTMVGGWAIFGVWRDRVSVKIDVRFGYRDSGRDGPIRATPTRRPLVSDDETLVVLTARNTGRRPISIVAGGISYVNEPRSMFVSSGRTHYPINLVEGRSGEAWSRITLLKQSVETNGSPREAYFDIAAGKTYRRRLPKSIIDALEES